MDAARIADMIDSKVNQSQNRLLSDLDNLISNRLSNFQQSLNESQKALSDAQVAKIEEMHADNYKFQRKGNEEQYKVNIKVQRKLRETEQILKEENDITTSVADAKAKIAEGIDIIDKRQKLIKMADSSPLGWKMVAEYENNSLADNSDDEKRMFKAEARAERKAKKVKKQWEPRRFQPYAMNRSSWRPIHTGAKDQENHASTSRGGVDERKRPGLCFACGKPGHWKADCLARGNRSGQISGSEFIHVAKENDTESKLDSIERDQFDSTSDLKALPKNSGNKINVSPVGRLKQNVNKWADFGASREILDIIENGYKLPLHTLPDSKELRNNRSALNHGMFVEEEIGRLLEKGCVTEVKTRPTVVNPLTVSENKDKCRLVLDCRHINPHLFKQKFKYEDTSVAKDVFEEGDHVFTFDLKSAYHHVEISEPHRQYLGFSWCSEGQTRYFVFNVLPFGISTAGYVFTKITRVPVTYWRAQGKKIVMFLDDGIAGCSDKTEAIKMSGSIKSELNELGFLLADEKCEWEPSSNATWLGLDWNFTLGVVHVTDRRIQKLKKSVESILTKVNRGNRLVLVRELASVAGQIISTQPAVGLVVQLKTREIFKCINSRASWNAPVLVSDEAVSEFKFWYKNIERVNGIPMTFVKPCNATLFTDASATGYGAYVCEDSNLELVGFWKEQEKEYSSSWREIEALSRALKSFGSCLEGQSVRWFTDNRNVTRIVQKGSRSRQLQSIALEIHETCEKFGLTIIPVWIPREQNTRADNLSKIIDSDDWYISPNVFGYLDRRWGPHTVDRFACDYNSQCRRFNSRWGCPNSEGVDAFKQAWSDDVNWWVPPPRLAARVIDKAVQDCANGTLVVPQWKSAPFWPKIFKGGKFAPFIENSFMFSSKEVKKGKGNNGIFGSSRTTDFTLIALKLRF
ncbi:uncharacterized protein [Diadema setosum]|uniref:uncharacterized protein n=1 Tax=Diadema setosum TaxID=31175 RepID=UPI003B3B6716